MFQVTWSLDRCFSGLEHWRGWLSLSSVETKGKDWCSSLFLLLQVVSGDFVGRLARFPAFRAWFLPHVLIWGSWHSAKSWDPRMFADYWDFSEILDPAYLERAQSAARHRFLAFLVEIQSISDSKQLLVMEPADSVHLEEHSFKLQYNILKHPASNGSIKSVRTFQALKIYSSFRLKEIKTSEHS